MPSVNKVILIGNLGRDPELRYSPSGTALCSISIATTRNWKDKASGEKREETEWHRVVFYERLAEVAGQYLKKGRPVYVEGRLRTRKWTDKDGVEKYSTEIIADEMQLLGDRQAGDQAERPTTSSVAQPPRSAGPSTNNFDDMDDDIPFIESDMGLDPIGRGMQRRMARYGRFGNKGQF